MTNSIIKELNHRANEGMPKEDFHKALISLLNGIIHDAAHHTSRIQSVFKEYDLHDASHSEKVLENISMLVGDDKIEKMPSLDLFILAASSYLHDIGMAPSDWEMKVLDLADGETVPYENKRLSDTINFITSHKLDIYIDFNHVSGWIFAESTEDALIKYLAETYQDYQVFRNGYTDRYQSEDKAKVDKECRLNYLRTTHHIRSAHYIGNMKDRFNQLLNKYISCNELIQNLRKIAQSHCEDINYVKALRKETYFSGNDSANPQFDAMMLRIADIIHFSSDRAPSVICDSKIFESQYSFIQWAIKGQAVRYSIGNGKIAFIADCRKPDYYYTLLEKFDLMDMEINRFNTIKSDWEDIYQIDLKEIDRTQVRADEEVFIPQPNMRFTLEQDKIIELLMGAKLYKNPYACLRELYQNSMDACRCMISKTKKEGNETKGKIEFGIEQDEGGKYVYCIDNGIGMAKEVIEHHFLKIGCSYYKSPEFYRKQAEWGSSFTPTSQFGIGVLSCFMIAKRIEVITKNVENEKLCFCVDGIHECFYYKPLQTLDEEKIGTPTGTFMKLYLKEPFETTLHNERMEKHVLLLSVVPHSSFCDFVAYGDLYKKWETHLYHILFDFIRIPHHNIEVNVIYDDGSYEPIRPQPYGIETIAPDDKEFISTATLKDYSKDLVDDLVYYPISIEQKGKYDISYHYIFALPKSAVIRYPSKYALYSKAKGICVDGISISSNDIAIDEYTRFLLNNGILNFIGQNRPQLSIDRSRIVSNHLEMEEVSAELSRELVKEVIKKTHEHIKRNQIIEGSAVYFGIWEYILNRLSSQKSILYLLLCILKDSEFGNIKYEPFSNVLQNEMSISDFLIAEKISFKRFNLSFEKERYLFLLGLLYYKSSEAISIKASDSTSYDVSYNLSNKAQTIPSPLTDFLFALPINRLSQDPDILFGYYDIVSGIFPFVSESLYNLFFDEIGTNYFRQILGVSYKLFYCDTLCIHPQKGFLTKPLFYNSDSRINIESTLLKENTVISIFYPPRNLTSKEQAKIEKYSQKDPDYHNGVMKGWTVLLWREKNKKDCETLILVEKMTKQKMVRAIHKYYEERGEQIKKCLHFTDGSSI